MSGIPKVGILPLYLKLYDDSAPDQRLPLERFLEDVTEALRGRGVDLVRAPVCRTESEVACAVSGIERQQPDLLIILHLAYSPSLESVGPLSKTAYPILLLDTTPDPAFGRDVDPQRLIYNHGIHGVQDLACMLRRNGKPFEIVAGHFRESDVMDRAAQIARAARAARVFKNTRALRIGESFYGMGDFAVADDTLQRRFGISVSQIGPEDLAPFVEQVSETALRDEMAADLKRFEADIDETVHRRSVRVGLGLRRYMEQHRIGALSASFLAFDSSEGPVDTVPFLEISKAMARGVGYGGEGDVLTASLVGALLAGFERTTFTEMFCPDWRGNSVFLSHMGEINPAVIAGKPRLCEKEFPFTPAQNPAYLTGAIQPAPAVLVNLAPGPEETFTLIIAPVEVLGDGTHPAIRDWIRAWIRPEVTVAQFLEQFSRLGGTHHSALVLGPASEALHVFARLIGVACRTIGGP